jgi:hypothetical protein
MATTQQALQVPQRAANSVTMCVTRNHHVRAGTAGGSSVGGVYVCARARARVLGGEWEGSNTVVNPAE